MIKPYLTCLLFLLSSVSAADELSLTNGYLIENVLLVDTLNGSIRYKGIDVVISLTPSQIIARQFTKYDSLKPSRFVLSNRKIFESFCRDHNIESDTVFEIKVLTMHHETIRGDIYQDADSMMIFRTNYGLVAIAKDLIVEPASLKNKTHKAVNLSKVTMLNGESFEGEQVYSADSIVTYRTNNGNLSVLKRDIKNVYTASLDNRHLLLGDTFAVTLADGQSFDGILLSSTDSSEAYRTNIGIFNVLKTKIKKSIMIVCGAPLDDKFLLFGNDFTVTMVSGESFDGKLISSTDSTMTYKKNGDTVVVLKRNIMFVLNTFLDNKSFKSKYAVIVALLNKESFRGIQLSSTDSTATFRTNIGDVTIRKSNILAVAGTLEDMVFQINEIGFQLPSMLSVYGGLAIPAGGFNHPTTGGDVQTGYTAGIQYVSGGQFGYLFDASFSSNSINSTAMINSLQDNLQHQFGIGNVSVSHPSAGNWSNILVLAGVKYETENSKGLNCFIAPMIGVDVSITPKISSDVFGYQYSGNSQTLVINTVTGSVTQTSASGTAFMYGAAAEAIIYNLFTINARYIAGKFNYNMTFSDNSKGHFEQNISLLQICIGVVVK